MNTEEREISLIDLLIYVAKGWRSILVWMLIMAVFVGGIQYTREIKAAREFEVTEPASGEEQKEQAVVTIEQLRKEMPEEEIKAVSKVVRLEKDYAEQMEYLENSLLMTMSPYEVAVARLQYWVDTNHKTNYAGITEKDVTSDIVESYINRVEDGSWKKAALKAIDADVELQYLDEMIGLIDDNSSFTIIVKYPDEQQLRKVVSILEEELKEYQDEVESVFGAHKLSLVNESVEMTVDNDIYNLQQARKNTVLGLENNIAGYKNAFNDNQKSLYAGEIIVREDETEEEAEGTAGIEEVVVAEPPAPQLRVKNFLLGAILGAFLICMVRAMRYILSGKLKAEDNVEGYLGVAGLGYIEEMEKEHRGVFGKLDAWIEGLSKRSYANLTKNQQLEMIVSNISLYCERGDMKQIYLNSSVNCTQEKGADLVRMLTEKGIEVKEGLSILRDAKAMEDMSRSDGVVFLEQAGRSRYEELEREIRLCKEHGKTVIGMVVLV